ncbi:MAG: ankyrin repeat domain-containing protein [Bacteriovorax sp.]|nr:ankyrin repeat domain-containing protein [Bacteriovorax sp.]
MKKPNDTTLKSEIKLPIELIPYTSWGNNPRSISPKDWKKLRLECYENAKRVCEICGDIKNTGKVECHEIWEFNDIKKVQTLIGLIALCPPCHQVKHIGLANKMGRAQNATEHLAEINNWTIDEANNYVSESIKKWKERSRYSWKLDLAWIKRKGIKVKNEKNRTPAELVILLEAIQNNDNKLVKYLLTKNNKYNFAVDEKGNQILHMVVRSKNLKVTKLFLNDPNFIKMIDQGNKAGITPLMLSCQLGSKEIVKLLVNAGASTSKKCKYKKSILHYVALSNNFETFKYVHSNYCKNLTNESDFKDALFFHRIMSSEQFFSSSLPRSIRFERKKILEYSLEFLTKDQVIKKDKFGKTFLHCIAYLGDRKTILKTLEKGGLDTIDSFDKYGKTPINEAALGLNIEAIKTLLEKNAKFRHKTNSGETAYEIIKQNMGIETAEEVFGTYLN